jgi:flagellar hook-length control protein FliK
MRIGEHNKGTTGSASEGLVRGGALQGASQAGAQDRMSDGGDDAASKDERAQFERVLGEMMQTSGAASVLALQAQQAQSMVVSKQLAAARHVGRGGLGHEKGLVTSGAEQELAGASQLNATRVAEAKLRGEQNQGQSESAGSMQAEEAGKQAQGRTRRSVSAESVRGAQSSAEGMSTKFVSQGSRVESMGLSSLGNGQALAQAATGNSAAQHAHAGKALKQIASVMGSLTGLTQGGGPSVTQRMGSASASRAVSGAAESGAKGGAPQAGVSQGGQRDAMMKPLADAGKESRTRALRQSMKQGVEQAATQGLALALKEGGGTATVRIAPESLGQLAIKLSVRDGEVVMQAQTQTDSARELLSESIPTLREALEAKGLHVRELHVAGPAANEVATRGQDASRAAESQQQDRGAQNQDGKRNAEREGGAFEQQVSSQEGKQLDRDFDEQPSQQRSSQETVQAERAMNEEPMERTHAEREALAAETPLEAGILQWIA